MVVLQQGLVRQGRQLPHFLQWVRDRLGGPIEMRKLRLNFQREKTGIRCQLMSRDPSLSSLTYPGLEKTRKGRSQLDLGKEDSAALLASLLPGIWGLDLNHPSSSLKGAFLRGHGLPREKVVVEFGSPNIAKPLHMGHLRSFVTGHFVAKISSLLGHEVVRICFLGDWGTQFGLLQAGIRKNQRNPSEVENMSLQELLQIYVSAAKEKETSPEFEEEALRLSAKLEEGDEAGLALWKTVRAKTVAHLQDFWAILGIQYDLVQGESEFRGGGVEADEALKQLKEKGLLFQGEDSRFYAKLEKDHKFRTDQNIPLVKGDGSSLYLLRDLAAAIVRKRSLGYDRALYVVDKTQTPHFTALFRLMEKLGLQKGLYGEDGWESECWHITFGQVEGMSTRKGNFVLLSDVLSAGSEIMEERRSKSPNRRGDDEMISRQLAISALIVHYLRMRRNKDVRFEWEEALRPEGETGVRLQYTHARLESLKRRVEREKPQLLEGSELDLDLDYLMGEELALDLALHLINFEDALLSCYSELEPCILLNHLFRLSDKISKGLKELRVLGEGEERVARTRLVVFLMSQKVLALGLNTVGIKPLNEM